MRSASTALVLALAFVPGCLSPAPVEMPALASAQVANDFETYEIRRVGLLPPMGDLDDATRADLQRNLLSELAQGAPFELVPLSSTDLEEVAPSDPFRRGWYRPETILALARRYTLDALLVATVTDRRWYPPQSLGIQADLVSAETGLVIWSSAVHLDATDEAVRLGLRAFYGEGGDDSEGGTAWQTALLSPERFARFAAFQIACLL